MALTDAAVRTAKADQKPKKLTDGGGLFLFVTPSGSKLWRLGYRFDGRQKTLAFGSYPLVSLAEARQRRDDAKRLILQGIDPGEQKRIERLTRREAAANTFGVIADEYLEKLRRERKADPTIQKNEWLLGLARPALGKRPITEISAAEVLAVLRKVETKGRLESARRLRSTIGAVFRYAIATARAANDPTVALRGALTTPVVKHRAAITDPKELGALLRAIDAFAGQPATHAALRLMPILFPRPGELRQAEWAEFDLDRAVWEIPAGRMKMRRSHRVPLPPQAIAILRDLHEITGDGRLAFPCVRTVLRPISDGTLNAALRRLGYGTDEVCAHGFRATASTLLNESGLWSADAIERQLAHVDADAVRRAYARGEHWDERVRMMGWWADYLDQLRSGGQVIPMRSGARG